MAINYEKLLSLKIPDTEQTYTERDVILYALGLAVGSDPTDLAQLAFVYEENLKVSPTFGVVLAHPSFWMRELDTGIDWVKLVHGEQGLVVHAPIPTRGTVVGRIRVVEVIDKGPGRGALVFVERDVIDKATGDPLVTVSQTAFCRGDGGFGGPPRVQPKPHTLPSRAPDFVCDIGTPPQLAAIYRLSGDYNPLHIEPAIAVAAGYRQPILHGLATFGIAGHAVSKVVCNNQPELITSMQARFTAPVYPGETFRTEIWRDGDIVSFQTRCLERDVVAISNGRILLGGSASTKPSSPTRGRNG